MKERYKSKMSNKVVAFLNLKSKKNEQLKAKQNLFHLNQVVSKKRVSQLRNSFFKKPLVFVYFKNNNSLYFGNGHNLSSTINSNLSL